MECTVSYDVWQMQCCGSTFVVGSKIKWLAEKRAPKNIPYEVAKIDYRYEAHSGDWEKLFVLEGTVTSIFWLYKSSSLADTPKWKLFTSDMAAGYEPEVEGMECQNYIVELTDCSVRPAAEEDLFSLDDELGEDTDYSDENQ